MDLMNDSIPPSITLLLLKATCDVKRITEQMSWSRSHIKSVPFAFLTTLMQGACTLTHIAKTLECSKQEASRLLKRADEQGWVHIESSVHDRREKQVSLSAQGTALLGIGIDIHVYLEQQLQQQLGTDQYQHLMALLQHTIACLGNLEPSTR